MYIAVYLRNLENTGEHHPTTIIQLPSWKDLSFLGVPYRVQDHIEPRVCSKESIIY